MTCKVGAESMTPDPRLRRNRYQMEHEATDKRGGGMKKQLTWRDTLIKNTITIRMSTACQEAKSYRPCRSGTTAAWYRNSVHACAKDASVPERQGRVRQPRVGPAWARQREHQPDHAANDKSLLKTTRETTAVFPTATPVHAYIKCTGCAYMKL